MMTAFEFFALFLVPESPFPRILNERSLTVVRDYSYCLKTKSIELEASKADFDDIWLATQTECNGIWLEAYESVEEDLKRAPPSSTGKAPEQLAFEFLESIADGVKPEARVSLLRKRAGLKVE